MPPLSALRLLQHVATIGQADSRQRDRRCDVHPSAGQLHCATG
ncbi:hypothetical protein NSERUTF1_5402 [Nocardia seriolae]|nr:hypothetical protein NSERUTF1_5402 [Nocardia seriolae]